MNWFQRVCLTSIVAMAATACAGGSDDLSPITSQADEEGDSVMAPPSNGVGLTADLPTDGPTTEEPPLNPPGPQCPGPIDFESGGNGVALSAGEVVSNLSALGVASISCITVGSSVDTCAIFDTANPTGGDWDLGSPNETFGGPGYGSGGEVGQVGQNDVPQGNVLILAENNYDGNSDGFIDDPDDNGDGGIMELTFAEPGTVATISLLDIDSNEEGMVEVLFDGGGSVSLPFQKLGDNSVQTLAIGQSNVIALKVHFTSSGALAGLEYCPDGGEPPPECVVDNDCNDPDLEQCVAGSCEVRPAEFSGITFFDSNFDGIYGGTDQVIPSTAVALHVDMDQNGIPDSAIPYDATVTGADGSYSFTNVDPYQTYVIGFQNLSGFGLVYTLYGIGDDNFDSDVFGNGYTATITTAPGDVKSNLYCGYGIGGI